MSKAEGSTGRPGNTVEMLQRTAMISATQLYEIRHIIDSSQTPDDLIPALELATCSLEGLRLIVEELDLMIHDAATIDRNPGAPFVGIAHAVDRAWAARR